MKDFNETCSGIASGALIAVDKEFFEGLVSMQVEQTRRIEQLERTLNNHEKVWARIDQDVQLFGNKVVGYGLEK